ncbi:tRNA(Thr) (cytosine(32)-N(3))-methyltransferase protein [Dioscorea alata]|uniref:tRNA(Thr) (Cytosine(32)-N(3))-methyltransferase protein n=2 Tax=Dioscorea alata TaxID=55571 RepID=A0ACB7UQG3_DIOAL|nr:tRNA(Thr) (cytosine(32)-N(3))-methyltransferase protein [Dioscorea alata]KAH7662898.1 tRNA(Thr) (cytosine(32)-N(3))-methyltransferase protein [Dioscorea alata]
MATAPTAEYHSRDFDWDELRDEVENDPSLLYHLTPSAPSLPPCNADSWRSFHRRHSSGKFFKERRYLLEEFPELRRSDSFAKVLEVGCGNGSTVLPILRAKKNMVIYACDCSTEVVERAKEIISSTIGISSEQRFHPFLLDFSVNKFPEWLFCSSCQNSPSRNQSSSSADAEEKMMMLTDTKAQCCIGGVDFVTLIFTLSAVPLQNMPFVLAECYSTLKPGCLLLFRDYGLYDMTMLRFPKEQKVGYREYMRLDGTLSYFFSLDIVRDLFMGAGFVELELEYCCVTSMNHKNGKKMQRVWVHGKFAKPS